MSKTIEISHQRITKVGQLKGIYTDDDGLGLYLDDTNYIIHDCIIDLSDVDLDEQDEAVGVTYGASASFSRCIIRGAGKLILCGSGDSDKKIFESGKTVHFTNCILENFGRRGPEVQAGMYVTMMDCLIRNWGASDRFNVRNFGVWAHDDGMVSIIDCVFWQDKFLRPFKQMWKDFWHHWWQAKVDGGVLEWFNPLTYLPGVCRGATSIDDGFVTCQHCYKNHWWIRLENSTSAMSKSDATDRIRNFEAMARFLEAELPR